MREFDALESRIGYRFKNGLLLRSALTHTSYVNENKVKDPLAESWERLEFLGDAVLGSVVSSYLYEAFPESDEGYLSEFRQHLVCEETLARVAAGISVGEYLLLGQGEQNHRNRSSLLSDALEALIGAIYLDSEKQGETVSEVVLKLFADEIASCTNLRGGDYKTRLLQLVQGDGEDILSYEVEKESGPAHDRVFSVVAKLNRNIIGRGYGKTKKEAEHNAAKEALVLFGMMKEN